MNGKVARLLRLLAVVLVTLAVPALAPAAQAGATAGIVVQAAGQGSPYLNLRNGEVLAADYAGDAALIQSLLDGQARPLALAAGDFDADGVPDLLAGYGHAGGGILTLRRGNVDSLYPNSPEARQRQAEGTFGDAPFTSPARVWELPAAPDWLGAGDWNNDGRLDVIAAARGDAALYLLPGDGQGGFGQAHSLPLPGGVTALAVGEVNRRDGLADLAVGVDGPDGPHLLVFEGPDGALRRAPEVFSLPGEATGLAVGQLDGDYVADLGVAAGSELLIVHGRDRMLALDEAEQAKAPPAVVDRRILPYSAAALAAGNLILEQDGYRLELALIGSDGAIHLLDPATAQEMATFQLPVPDSWRDATLQAANVSSRPIDDLLVTDRSGQRLEILPGDLSAAPAMLEVAGGPAAALPLRLNTDALDDLVLLRADAAAPAVAQTAPAATFTVNETGDQGDECAKGDGVCAATQLLGDPPACTVVAGCTLRAALDEANNGSDADTILFAIPGAGPHTIQPLSYLEAAFPVVLDGASQPGYAGSPAIKIAGSPDVGLYLSGGDTVVRGLAFTGASQHGVQIDNFYGWNGGNTILEGNYFGIEPDGTQCAANSQLGVAILNVANNRVGGTVEAARNVLSCNGAHGIQISDSAAATLNRVIGNYIGADAAGTAGKGNYGSGVAIAPGSNNDIGGSTAAERNVIAHNGNSTGSGVIIAYPDAAGNIVAGNYIGLDKNGAALGNLSDGVGLVEDAHHNTVGGTAGTTPGGACSGECNLISDNGGHGVYLGVFTGLTGAGQPAAGGRAALPLLLGEPTTRAADGEPPIPTAVTGNLVRGNLIGVKADGLSALGNQYDGVHLASAPGNTIGGDTDSARNLISGNKREGVYVQGSLATGNTVAGNYIGVDTTGAIKAPNTGNGVRLDGAPGNTVRGCLISGNGDNGVYVSLDSASGNTVQDNVIGVNAWADQALGNAHDGVRLDSAPGNTVKGNVIGGNGYNQLPFPDAGVKIVGTAATGNQVQGNSIGVDTVGTIDLGNAGAGVMIDGAPGNIVGGAAAGEGNLISRNWSYGIHLRGEAASGNTVRRNQIGTDRVGVTAQGNSSGVFVEGAPGTVVEGNLISGNSHFGLLIRDETADGTQVRGNYIGTNLAGDGKVGDQQEEGVTVLYSATHTLIEDNLISGHKYHGVSLDGVSWTTVRGNRIGTDASGAAKLGNGFNGVIIGGSAHTIIGVMGRTAPGACTGGCNLISGNGRDGITLTKSQDSLVIGNYVGTTLSGNAGLGNGNNGITAGGGLVRANVVADSGRTGIEAKAGKPIEIAGNYVGVGADGATPLPNKQWGIYMWGGASNTVRGNRIWHSRVGIVTAQARVFHNSVRFSGPVFGNGINCDSSAVSGNEITGNKVGLSDVYSVCRARRNNIQGNSEYGASAVGNAIDAVDNWWGAADGPGGAGPGHGDKVTAGVIYQPWLGSPVAVEVTPGGTVYGPPGGAAAGGEPGSQAGQAASGWIYVQNWANLTDTLEVTVVDSLGWLIPPASFTVPISGGLGGGALVSFTIPAGAPIGAASLVTATAVSQANPADSDQDTFLVIAALPADLALSKASDVDSAAIGQQIHYTLAARNAGPNAAGGVVVTDVLPAEVELVSAQASQGSCAQMTGTVVCELGALAAGAQATVDLAVTVTAANEVGQIVNGAWVEVAANGVYDPNLEDNGDSATVEILTGARAYLPLVARNWPPPAWHSECVDCPPSIGDLTYGGQAVDAAGHPHVAYGGDQLYHAWHDGATWQIEVADASPSVGQYASIALDSSGRPHIAYLDSASNCLKYAHWDGAAWLAESVDCGGSGVVHDTSIALDADDRPHISYADWVFLDEANLRYAHWDGTTWQVETVEVGQDGQGHPVLAGYPNSLALDGSSRPHIAYRVSGWGSDPDKLKYAYWDGAQWQKEIVTTSDYVSEASLALDSGDRPHIGYETGGALRYTRWTGAQWQTYTVATSADGLEGPCLALNGADQPRFSYYYQHYVPNTGKLSDLRYTWSDTAGATWQFETLHSGFWTDAYDQTSLALDSGSQPLILYETAYDFLLRHARRPGATWQIETIAQSGEPGAFSSLALDGAGRPHVAYLDEDQAALKYARWDGAAWQIQTVTQGASYGDIGMPSLALEAGSGYPRIAFASPDGLRYAAWTGSTWQMRTVDPQIDEYNGGGPSLALDSAGRAHISYFTQNDHRYARWTGATWQISIVDNLGSSEPDRTSLALDGADQPHIAYADMDNWDLRYAWWDGSAWQRETVESAGSAGLYFSLALDSAGQPRIAYQEFDAHTLKYARREGSTWQLEMVDGDGQVGYFASLALDGADRPHISYHDSDNDTIKYAWWDGTQWQIETLEGGNVGWYSSLALDSHGWPHISHHDRTLKDLRYTWFGP